MGFDVGASEAGHVASIDLTPQRMKDKANKSPTRSASPVKPSASTHVYVTETKTVTTTFDSDNKVGHWLCIVLHR